MTKNKISLFPILSVNFIGTFGFSIVIPFLVILVTKFGGNALVYGLIGATYSVFQFIGAPILGRWSDKYGRKKVLLLSQGGTLIAWIIFLLALFLPTTLIFNIDSRLLGSFALTLPLVILFIARALDGITGGNISVANAYLADITSKKDRSKNFGRMAVSSNLGFIIGPALAGLLGATIFGEAIPVLAAILISVVALLVIFFKLPESHLCVIKKNLESDNVRKIMGQEHKECYHMNDKATFKDIMKMKNIPLILLLYFLMFIGFNIFYATFPIHAILGLGWSITQMGIFFSILSFVMVIVQGPILSRVTKIASDSLLTVVGSIILGLSFIFFMSSGILIYMGLILFAVGNGIMWPSFLSILSKVAGKDHQGSVQGYGSSAGSLASIIGLILGGFLYSIVGALSFLAASAAIFLAFLLSIRLLSLEKIS